MPRSRAPKCFEPTPYTAEQNESMFQRDYGFNKPVPARSPVDGYSYNYIRSEGSMAPPKERKLVVGTPWKSSHRRMSNSYGSRPATRHVGKAKSR